MHNSCDFPMFILFGCSHQNTTVELKSIVRNCQKIKNGVVPKNPTNVDELNETFKDEQVMNTYGFSQHKEDRRRFFDVAVQRNDYSYCVFSSKHLIELALGNLVEDDLHVLMDATFKIVPFGGFSQLLILYIRVKHEVSFNTNKCIIHLN